MYLGDLIVSFFESDSFIIVVCVCVCGDSNGENDELMDFLGET